jgi:hypothetical protein
MENNAVGASIFLLPCGINFGVQFADLASKKLLTLTSDSFLGAQ